MCKFLLDDFMHWYTEYMGNIVADLGRSDANEAKDRFPQLASMLLDEHL